MVRWLEENGYDVSYIGGVDIDACAASLLQQHKVFMSVGHDEYWSANQRATVEAARDAGVNLAFFSGNQIFWKTRVGAEHRRLVDARLARSCRTRRRTPGRRSIPIRVDGNVA